MSYPLLGRPHLLRALDELVEIAEGTRMKLHYSHAIFVGRRSFRCKDELVSILNSLKDKGIDVGLDTSAETPLVQQTQARYLDRSYNSHAGLRLG